MELVTAEGVVDSSDESGAPVDPAELLERLGDMVSIAVVGADGRFQRVSDRWCTATGWLREDAVGAHWKAVVHPEDLTWTLAESRAAAAAVRRTYDVRIVSSDGTRATWTQTVVTPVLDDRGHPRSWLAVALDVSELKASAEALERSERRLQVIFDNLTDIVTILEPDGSLRSTNAIGNPVFGSTGEPLPENALSMVHPDDQDRVVATLEGLVADPSRSGLTFEHRAHLPGGPWCWLETVAVSLVDDPAVGGIVLHSRDVTERHESASELSSMASRLTSLAANLLVGVVMADEQGRLIFVNRAATDLFSLGIEPDQMIGRHARQQRGKLGRIYRDGDAELARIEEILAARSEVREEPVAFADGRTVARSFVPIFDDGAFRGYLWLFRDLSDEVAVATEREHLLEMEKEQNRRLKELDALKTDLVVSVSHELRTPLTSIVSFANLLRDGLGTDPVEEQAEFLDIIERNSDRLLRLVDDLLLLERLGSGALLLDCGTVRLPELVDEALASIRPVAEAKGVELASRVGSGAPLYGDAGKVAQLVDNLLANAVKFTPAGGRVVTTCVPSEQGWLLEVADTGIGIPAAEIGGLFDRFYRASNARRLSASGSGLGLAIARRIAELHHGRIVVESEQGCGTTVAVELAGADPPGAGADPTGADPLGTGADPPGADPPGADLP